MKEIEEGCTAIIIGGLCESNIGKIVNVGKFIGIKEGFGACDLWEIDRLIDFGDGIRDNVQYALCSEKTMERIDDDTIDKEHETESTIKDKNYE